MSFSNLTGLWVDKTGEVHGTIAKGDAREPIQLPSIQPFLWTNSGKLEDGIDATATQLSGEGALDWRWDFATPADYTAATKMLRRDSMEQFRTLESQWLARQPARLFAGMTFNELRRCQMDIETGCEVPGGFSDPTRKGDRVLAIGLRMAHLDTPVYLTLQDDSDEAERALLEQFSNSLQELDPDIIEGHNIFNFDLDYLRQRCRRLKVDCQWGRYGQKASFRRSRLRVAERDIDFQRCDMPGRTVFDTLFAIQLWDISARALPNYKLKDVAIHLGITQPNKAENERTYIDGAKIADAFKEDRATFLAYLGDDLRETAGLADFLLPTYLAQTQNFPMTLQEICLRGTGAKVDALLLEKYLHNGASLPAAQPVARYEGGFTKSYVTGVYRHVLHYDVASLYPSLMLNIGRGPAGDSQGVFIPLLKELRSYRLQYKKLARETEDPTLQREYDARQQSFKILINSFYGYLGFAGARFADGELAAEITRRGRELLQALIKGFEEEGAQVLEADTDGIYLSSEAYYDKPEALLDRVVYLLPEGIELEHDGNYPAMLCYAAKNYALYDGERVILRGSAIRSRGIEPFLKDLTNTLIDYQLGASDEDPKALLEETRKAIEQASIDVKQLAKREYLSMSPEAYKKKIESGGKPRRASLEVALTMDPIPSQGEAVSYYLCPKEKGQTSDWQRARALDQYEPTFHPYDPKTYLKKLKDWEKRWAEFL